jgi:hypothetical protein
MKPVLAVLAGAIIGIIVIQGLESVGRSIFPLEFDFKNMTEEEWKNLILNLPIANLVSVIIAHFIGTIAAMFVTSTIDNGSSGSLFIVAGVLLTLSIVNIAAIAHPTWFIIADLGAIILASFVVITMKKA